MLYTKFPIELSHDHTGFGAQIPFMGSVGLFLPFLTHKSIYFLHLYLHMGHIAYFIFEPPSAQPRDLNLYQLYHRNY
jgi:hypothetical protein